MAILGRSAKYTWVTGGKIDPTPLNYKSYAVRRQKMSQKYWSEKKLEGVSILGVVKKMMTSSRVNDVTYDDKILSGDVNP